MKNLVTILLVCFFALVGCGSPSETADTSGDSGGHSHGHDHSHDHDAPNGGFLVDIGHDHKYHAEIVDDHETNVVTVHMLDGDLKALQISQPSISMILSAGDQSETFELKGEGESSSAFKLKDDALMAMLDTDGVKGIIRVTIEDKPFKGNFEYKHDHDHDH